VPYQYKPFNNEYNRRFNYVTPNKNYSTEPERMSVQTRQTEMFNRNNSRLTNPNFARKETYIKENIEVSKDRESKHFFRCWPRQRKDEMMNISQQSKLPYLKIKDYMILLDTGSSINLVNKSYVYRNREKFKIFNEKFEFHTATSRTRGNEFVFIQINNNPIKCYLFNFQKKFNVLLGVPTTNELNIKWDTSEDLITLGNEVIKLKYFGEKNLKYKNNNNFENNNIEARLNHLNEFEKREIENLIKELNILFPEKGEKLSYTSVIKHRINTTDEIPVYTKQYRYPQVYKQEIDKQVSELLDKDVR